MVDMPTLSVPLRTDDGGAIRVGGTRVTLDTILDCYRQGDTPEGIHAGFPTVSVSIIYAVIAYYLEHREEIDAYLERREAEAERLRSEIEANYSPEAKARTEYFRDLLAKKRQQDAS